MKIDKDAFGKQLLAEYEDRSIPEIVERDDGFISVGRRFGPLYFSEYPKWSPSEKRAIKFVKGKILDIGSGAGRHSLYLQEKGFDVTALDNSEGAVKVCKMRGLKKIKHLSIDNIEQLAPNKFDTILMLGNNFGLFGNKKKAKTILKKLYQVTSPTAQIVAETNNPVNTTNPIHLAYHKRNQKLGRMKGQIRIRIRFKNLASPWFDYLFVTPDEMKSLLVGTGWKISKLIDPKAVSYIAVITK